MRLIQMLINQNREPQAAIDAKQKALDEAKLDNQLKEQGLNPNDFATPEEKKKYLLSQQMTIKSLTTGFGNLSRIITD